MSETAFETYAFQAEINQLLSLIINAFYSNKDVFLRELVSNASDALDKVRYKSLVEGADILGSDSELRVRIQTDKTANTITISDNGIGMSKEELVKNLGTIAHSGTKAFMQSLKEGTTDLSLIGQFGMGFYSAFLVADKVTVVSKGCEEGALAHEWESSATGSFTVKALDENDQNTFVRGTRIILHIKEEMKEYLEESRIREIISKHSQFINFPIELLVEREEERQVEETSSESTEDVAKVAESAEEGTVVEEVTEIDANTEKEQKKNTITERVKTTSWEQLNKQKPLWMRPASEVTTEEYASFYKSVFQDWEDHLTVKHFSAEGSVQYKALLYTPRRAPFDLFQTDKKPNNIKLYVRKVFIMDDCEDLCPPWLSFVKGVIDTDDLPLNVSREMLQQNSVMKVLKKGIVKKCIDMFQDLADNHAEDFKKFYEAFGKNIKLGVHDDAKNKDKLIDLLRFYSSKSGDDMTSLKDYVTRMKEGQKDIYYITGESRQAVQDSPLIEALRKRGYEILFLVDPIDEYMVQQLSEYDGKKLVCCSKDGLVFEDEKETLEKKQEEFKTVCQHMKEILGEKVQEVKVSGRVTETPCVLVTPQYGWTANMERIVKAQALRTNQDMMGFMGGRRILEINAGHKIIQELKRRFESDSEDDKNSSKKIVTMLYETSLISSGFSLEEPTKYAHNVFRVMLSGLSLEEEDEPAEVTVVTDDTVVAPPESKMEEVD